MALAALPQTLLDRFQTARELLRKPDFDEDWERCFPTTVEAFDRLLNGGLVRGELVELTGLRSNGRFSLVLTALATATSVGESVALVDLGDHFDPQEAKTLGLDLERLLWLRPRHLKEALAAAEVLISGGFPLVALDIGVPPIPGGRGSQSSWQRLVKSARDHHSALLVSTPYRSSGPAASVVIEARRAAVTWRGNGDSPKLLEGLRSRITLGKARGRAAGSSEEIRLRYCTGSVAGTEHSVLPMLPAEACCHGTVSEGSVSPRSVAYG